MTLVREYAECSAVFDLSDNIKINNLIMEIERIIIQRNREMTDKTIKKSKRL